MDLNELKLDLSFATQAIQKSIISEEMEHNRKLATAIAQESAQRTETLVAGAEASIEQRNLIEQQLGILHEQNSLLFDNYEKLKEMYDAQVKANKEANDELTKTKRYNAWMMVVSVISMLAAIASTVIPFLIEQTK